METADLISDEFIAWFDDRVIDAAPRSFDYFAQKVLPLIDQREVVKNVLSDKESKEYYALSFEFGEKKCLFRQAKTTPKKVGQFVTIWKREYTGAEIAPFENSDDIDFVIVAVHDAQNQGFFIFDKETLVKRRVFTDGLREGKRAIRVYAPWIKPTVKQAISTQKWQTAHFFSLDKQNEYVLQWVKGSFT
ncbi:MepB family protein [Shewanella sp. VB17]|uniref:MepB family protein n=1 Tax=Shewanella sp. VB17 TaxID=2739432 RepID=UPI001565BFE9|nr:MepB family protein [Shewanella sp. VB17]NRD75086.1 MepB family protein [Shewanella sp. VB17]